MVGFLNPERTIACFNNRRCTILLKVPTRPIINVVDTKILRKTNAIAVYEVFYPTTYAVSDRLTYLQDCVWLCLSANIAKFSNFVVG